MKATMHGNQITRVSDTANKQLVVRHKATADCVIVAWRGDYYDLGFKINELGSAIKSL